MDENALTVAKFGGTSVADGEAMARSISHILADESIGAIVISATAKTTNQLEELAAKAMTALNDADTLLDAILARHLEIAAFFSLNLDLSAIKKEASDLCCQVYKDKTITPAILDHFYSFGERLSSEIFAQALSQRTTKEVKLIQATDLFFTDESYGEARPDLKKIGEKASELRANLEDRLYVTQGFLGISPNGHRTTFGREGSDFSAALLAHALNASLLQIWTDVPGVASFDPRIVDKVTWIPRLTYEEASELARGGAKVLFSETLGPVKEKGIPVWVGSSFLGREGGGTLIQAPWPELQPRFIALAQKGERLTLVGHDIDKFQKKIEKEFGRDLLYQSSSSLVVEKRDLDIDKILLLTLN